ncbi:MAG: DUF4157 domain-containing protein [Propionivibrio sp.]
MNTRIAEARVAAKVPSAVNEVLRSPGQPLDSATRAFMEPRFFHNFANVRVHNDARAAESARAVHAQAYTIGDDLVFAPGKFAPTTNAGRELLGHELAHAVQQQSAVHALQPESAEVFESSAAAAGHTVANGGTVSSNLPACGVSLARAPVNPEEFDDQQLAEELERASVNLKSGEEPGWWLRALQTESNRRGRGRGEAARQHAERAALEGQAEAAIARDAQLQKKWKEQEQADAANDERRRAAKGPTSLSSIQPDPRLEADERKMERNYGEAARDLREAQERLAPAKDRRSLKNRLAAARAGTPDLNADFSAIWNYGRNHGLIAEFEEESTRAAFERPRAEKAHQEAGRAKVKAEQEQLERWEAQGEQLRSPEGIVQPFLVGAAAPWWAAAAYFATQTGEMAADTYNACLHGTAEDCAAATAKVAAAVALARATRGKPEARVQSERPSPPPGSATETSPPPAASGNTVEASPARPPVQSVRVSPPSPRKATTGDASLDQEIDSAFSKLAAGKGAGGSTGRFDPARDPHVRPGVRVPVNKEGTPADVLDVGAGSRPTDLGLPPEKNLVAIKRSDINQGTHIDHVFDATTTPPTELLGKMDALLINNPRGYIPNIAELGKALKPNGRIIVQGRARIGPASPKNMKGFNPDFQALVDGPAPNGFKKIIEINQGGLPPSPTSTSADILGGPFYKTEGDQRIWPNARVIFERVAEGEATETQW